MKICGYCGEENENSFLYCMKCSKDLPRQEKIDNMLSIAEEHMDRGEVRDAYRQAEKVLNINVGSKKAWFFLAVSATKLGMAHHSADFFDQAGVDYDLVACYECKGRGKCIHCGEAGKCYMCNGVGACSICSGAGKCTYCSGGDTGCAACRGTGKCPSCKGSGECPVCKGVETCPYCKGSKECHVCGGTLKAIRIKAETVEPELRKYLES